MRTVTNKQLLLTPEGFIVNFIEYAVKNLKANILLTKILKCMSMIK